MRTTLPSLAARQSSNRLLQNLAKPTQSRRNRPYISNEPDWRVDDDRFVVSIILVQVPPTMPPNHLHYFDHVLELRYGSVWCLQDTESILSQVKAFDGCTIGTAEPDSPGFDDGVVPRHGFSEKTWPDIKACGIPK